MNDLPKGWEVNHIENLFEIIKNKGIEGINPYLEIGNININNKEYILTEKCSVKGCKKAQKGDILISRVRPTRGAITWVNENSLEVSSAFTILRNKYGFNDKYLFYYLAWNNDYLNYLGENCTGTMYPTVSENIVVTYKLPIAPINEQHRIVAKLKKILNKINACKERLNKIPTILKRFRQSILSAACSGGLTKDWRKKNADIESAEVLLQKIQKTITHKRNNTNSNIRTNGLPEIPFNWKYVTIREITEDIKYGTAKKCDYKKTGVPVLRIPNVGEGIINLTDLKYAELSSKEYKQLKLKQGDILLIRSNGSVSLVGKTAIVGESEKDFAYAGYLIRLRFNMEYINSYFLNYVLSSYYIRLQIEVPARSTSGVNNINSNEIRDLIIPFPPISEQQEIVRRIESLFNVADKIENRYKKAKDYVDKLTQSILAKAFRGELVPQDPSDEPASVLLEKIREEKCRAQKPSKTKVKIKKYKRIIKNG